MNIWNKIALPAALLGLAGSGAAVAPAAHAQSTTPRVTVAPRALKIAGAGSHIGVSVREVEDEDLKTAKLSAAVGVLVEDVSSGSPAEKAGLKTGDVIVEFDGERVRSTMQFSRLVQETPSGRKVPFAVMRGGQRTLLTVEPTNDSSSFTWWSSGKGGILQDFAFAPFKLPTPPTPPPAPAIPGF